MISGRKVEREERTFLHRGIATRSFERNLVLGDYVRVKSAELKDGLLSIELAREIRDEMKPRKIEITGFQHSTIEHGGRNDNNTRARAAA